MNFVEEIRGYILIFFWINLNSFVSAKMRICVFFEQLSRGDLLELFKNQKIKIQQFQKMKFIEEIHGHLLTYFSKSPK